MDEVQQRTLAVWAVFVVPFVVLVVFLAWHHSLSLEIVAIYWFPSIVLTLIGAIPPPWTAFSRDF